MRSFFLLILSKRVLKQYKALLTVFEGSLRDIANIVLNSPDTKAQKKEYAFLETASIELYYNLCGLTPLWQNDYFSC
jgi:hypothetical protein